MYIYKSKLVIAFMCLYWIFSVNPVLGQTAEVTQRVIPAAELRDLAFLSSFLEEQFILPEDPEYTHGLFFDLTRDGFGSNDLLILYPAEEQFLLSTYLPEQMAAVLSVQGLSTDYNLITSRARIDSIAVEAEQETNPKKALAGSFLGSFKSYYPNGDFEGYISLQEDQVVTSFWGFTEELWEFTPEIAQCVQPDSEPVMLLAHKQPEIRAFLEADGCVVVESSTTTTPIISRECEK